MNRPFVVTSIAIAALWACGPSAPTDATDDTDTDADTVDTDDNSETGLDETGGEDTARDVDPPFTEARYKVEELRILPSDRGLDLNDDGIPDNKVAAVLEIVDSTLGSSLGSFSIDDVNVRIAEMLFAERAIILMQAEATDDAGALEVSVVRGKRETSGDLFGLADDYASQDVAKQRLPGRFTSEDTFEVGPGPLTIPIQFYPSDPVIDISAAEAFMAGDIDTREIDGRIAGAFLIDQVMAGMVEPLIEDYFGTGSTADGWNSTIRAILELQADLEIGGEPALSGAFSMRAEATDWEHADLP